MALPQLEQYGYTTEVYLGHGNAGYVYRATYIGHEQRGRLQPSQAVAIKVTPADKVRKKEILFQASLEHQNVIRLYDVFRCRDQAGQSYLCTVMELADPTPFGLRGSSLWSCIEATVQQNMEAVVFARDPSAVAVKPLLGGEPMLRWVFLQVASALDYLHRHPLYLSNRDVKAENVLVVDFKAQADGVRRPIVKLADFGFVFSAEDEQARSRLGTPNYVAPEIYLLPSDRSRSYNGDKADVWSAGVMLYTLATGLRPFVESPGDAAATIMARMADARYLQHSTFAPARLVDTSPELIALLRGMMEQDPDKRLTMRQVLAAKWSAQLTGDIRVKNGAGQLVALPLWEQLTKRADFLVAATQARWDESQRAWAFPHLSRSGVEQMLDDISTATAALAASDDTASPAALREGGEPAR